MPRRLFTLLTALSLLMCLATCVLWLRSRSHNDYVGRYHADAARLKWSMWHASSDGGTLSLVHGWMTFASRGLLEDYAQNYRPVEGWFGGAAESNRRAPRSFWERLGFSRRATLRSPTGGYGTASFYGWVEFPHWLPASAAAALPAARVWRRWRTRRRLRVGVCPACGYDLRATPGRCPECGTPAGTAPA